MNDSNTETLQSDAGKQGSNETGKQGSKTAAPFAPTTSILNADGIEIAWDLIEQTSREYGIPTAASKFKIDQNTIQARKRLKKWKRIPDMRGHRKSIVTTDAQLQSMEGDLSGAIDRHRATVFKKTSDSIAKFRAKAPKNFREFDAADKIARRALGIDDDKPMQQSVLIKINEAIDEHEAVPIEATEIEPCNPEPITLESGNQGSNAPTEPARTVSPITPPVESNAPKESNTTKGSLTLNPTDAPARRFVLP